MSSCTTLLKMFAVERVIRCEKQTDVPDHDGSKPLMFSIDGKDLQATNRKGEDWNPILSGPKRLYWWSHATIRSFQEMAREWQAEAYVQPVQEEIASHEQLCYPSRNVIGWEIVSVREVSRRTRSWWHQTVRFFHRRQRLASIEPQRCKLELDSRHDEKKTWF